MNAQLEMRAAEKKARVLKDVIFLTLLSALILSLGWTSISAAHFYLEQTFGAASSWAIAVSVLVGMIAFSGETSRAVGAKKILWAVALGVLFCFSVFTILESRASLIENAAKGEARENPALESLKGSETAAQEKLSALRESEEKMEARHSTLKAELERKATLCSAKTSRSCGRSVQQEIVDVERKSAQGAMDFRDKLTLAETELKDAQNAVLAEIESSTLRQEKSTLSSSYGLYAIALATIPDLFIALFSMMAEKLLASILLNSRGIQPEVGLQSDVGRVLLESQVTPVECRKGRGSTDGKQAVLLKLFEERAVALQTNGVDINLKKLSEQVGCDYKTLVKWLESYASAGEYIVRMFDSQSGKRTFRLLPPIHAKKRHLRILRFGEL